MYNGRQAMRDLSRGDLPGSGVLDTQGFNNLCYFQL